MNLFPEVLWIVLFLVGATVSLVVTWRVSDRNMSPQTGRYNCRRWADEDTEF